MPTSQKFSVNRLGQKGVVHLFLPIILLLGIIGGVFLVTNGNPLKYFSSASNPPIVIKSSTGASLSKNPSTGAWQSDSATVTVELTSLFGLASVSGPSGSGTTGYKFSEAPDKLATSTLQPYISNPTTFTYTFSDSTKGHRYLWVEFLGANGKTSRASATIELTGVTGDNTSGFGLALRFNQENSRVQVDSSPDLNQTSEFFTINVWVKPYKQSLSDSNPHVILSKESKNGSNPWYKLYLQNGKAVFSVYGGDWGNQPRFVTGRTTLEADRWYHITGQIRYNDVYLFVNGFADEYHITTPRLSRETAENALTIGCLLVDGNCVNQFYGEIDELRIRKTTDNWGPIFPNPQPYSLDSYDSALYHFNGGGLNDKQGVVNAKSVGNVSYVKSTIPTTLSTTNSSPSADHKRVFVTSITYKGNLGGMPGADTKCQERANVAGLGGSWKAWLSDSVTSATSRLNHSTKPYKLLDGTTIANNWDDLIDGSLFSNIVVNEHQLYSLYAQAWTNTELNGNITTTTKTSVCQDWTSESSSHFGRCGGYRQIPGSTITWTNNCAASCDVNETLYCFEQ